MLRALCTLPGADARAKLADELRGYRWENTDHRVIYETLLQIDSADGETLRQELPAAVTRMGFPDIHWGRFFAATVMPISTDRISGLIRKLRAGVSGH